MKFAHTNLIAKDWRRLVRFYQDVFACKPLPPERDMRGEWLDRATGVNDAHIRGIHLRLPGFGEDGPTLEIFSYGEVPEHTPIHAATPGFSHIAFAVDDVETVAQAVLDAGGSAIGELTERDVDGVGRLTFQYMADPEGNIVEIQNWQRG